MRFWAYSTHTRTCGRCERTIRAGEVALRLRLQSAPHVGIWRCTDCVGTPPADVIAAAEAIAVDEAAAGKASLLDRLEAIARRFTRRPHVDGKARATGEAEP